MDIYEKALKKIEDDQKCIPNCYNLINQSNQIGPTGPTGPQGIVGPTGPTGPQGIQGMQGIQGIPGTSVSIKGSYNNLDELLNEHQIGAVGDAYLVGDDLYVWSENEQEWTNVGTIRGPQGIQGPMGPQGIQGEIGPEGVQGPTGPRGLQGPTGLEGAPGPIGPQGEIGPTGPTGPMGPQGIQGESGIPGIPGKQGPPGFATLSSYGGKYNNTVITFENVQIGNWVRIPLTTSMPTINMKTEDEENNNLTLKQDGIYFISYFVKASCSANTTLITIVTQDNVNIPSTVIYRDVQANEEYIFSASAIVSLDADQKIDLQISSTDDNVTIGLGNGMNASLVVFKIDEQNGI